jgi:formate dehydrogenase subunit delta
MSAGTVPPHVRLANEIAVQFHTRPPAEAAATMAAHMRQFWDPRMRAHLLEHVAAGGADLDPLAIEAAAQLRPGAVR